MDINLSKINQDNRMMHQLAHNHNLENPGHSCQVYFNFIDCRCGFHAHLSGYDYMIRHNRDYSVIEHISPK